MENKFLHNFVFAFTLIFVSRSKPYKWLQIAQTIFFHPWSLWCVLTNPNPNLCLKICLGQWSKIQHLKIFYNASLKAPVEHRRPAARHSPHVLWARLQAECSLPLAHLSTTPSTAGTCSCGRQCHFTKAKSLTERADGSGGNSETGELKGQRLLLSWVAQGSAAKEAVSGWGEAWEGLKEPEACSTSRAAASRRPHLCFTNLSVKSLLGRLSCEMSRQSPIVTEVQEVPQIRPRYGARRTGTLPRSRAAGAAGEWGRAQAEGTGPHTPNASAACSHPATSSSSSGNWKHVSPYKGHGLCFLAVLKLCGKWHMQKWHAEKKFKIHCLGAKVPAGASYINVTALTPEGHTASTSALNFFPWNLIFLQKLFFFFFSSLMEVSASVTQPF